MPAVRRPIPDMPSQGIRRKSTSTSTSASAAASASVGPDGAAPSRHPARFAFWELRTGAGRGRTSEYDVLGAAYFPLRFWRRGRLSGDGVRHCVLCPARFRRDAVRDGVRVSADGVRHCVLCSARSRREAVRDGVRVSADGVRHCVLGPARSRRDAVLDGVRIPAYGVPAPHSMQPR